MSHCAAGLAFMNHHPPPTVAAVVCDLLFGTRIGSTARALGIDARIVRDLARLREELERSRTRLVLVDLELPEEQAMGAITAAAGHASRPKVVAFVSHVHEQLAKKAKDAGADEVLPRSRFSYRLPTLLATLVTPTDERSEGTSRSDRE
jgi:DNA-binding response OmpR family regulator